MDSSKITSEISEAMINDSHAVAKPTVLILVGLQYAGKSYLAERIKEHNFAHFWATNIKKQYGIANDVMIEVAVEVVRVVLAEQRNIIIDFVNHKHATRKKFQDTVEQLGATYKVVYIDTPKEERLRRREENAKSGDLPGRRVISLEQMQQFEDDFEVPTSEENLVILKCQNDVENFVSSLQPSRNTPLPLPK